jgi:phage terminase small subunit
MNTAKTEELKPVKLAALKKHTAYLEDLNLKPKELKFCWYYVQSDFNSRKAIEMAGYVMKNVNSVDSKASQLLSNLKIKQAISRIIQNYIGEVKDNLEKRILQTLSIQAFYDPFMFIDEKGGPAFEVMEDIPEKYRCCIEGIETKYYAGSQKSSIVIKLVDRKWALEKLSKYIHMIKDHMILEQKLSNESAKKLKDIFDNRPKLKKDDMVIDFPERKQA